MPDTDLDISLNGREMAMALLKLFLFGQPRLERAGTTVEISLHKALALLAYLAVNKQVYSRDALATLFWPESDASTARASLRRTLYALNKTIGETVLAINAETVGLDPRANLWLDVDAFSDSVRECASPTGPSELISECVSRLEQATVLYADDFLVGFTLSDSPAFDEWQFFEAERLRRELARVLILLVQTHQTRGGFDQAIQYARRWLALDSLHEPAHRQLMQLYAWSGQQAAALRQYQQCVKTLQDELGASPQPETTELYESIRLGQSTAPPVKPRARPETRYVQSGEVHIAYQVLGDGPVDLVFVSGFVSDLEQFWDEPGLARFFRRLASFSRLILFDKRGMGLSDRVGYPPTLENTMDDILAVMNAVGSARAVLMGVSEGGTNSALFAATYPERLAGLILYGAAAKQTKTPDYPWPPTREQYDKWLRQVVDNWGKPLSLEMFAPSRAKDEKLAQWWAKSLRLASSPGEIKAILQVMRDIDVRVALPAVRAPTLVLHRVGDRTIRVGNGRYVASQIPGAKYIELAGDDHFWWVGDADSILNPIETFLKELKASVVSDRVLATILVVEFVPDDQRQGEEIQQQNARAGYQALLTKQIERFRGRAVNKKDNPSIILFDGPSRAIQCAVAIGQAAREAGILIRAGAHTGECEITSDRTSGVAVQSAVSVMEKAAAGEVLVSSTVKDLVIGSGFQFVDRGVWNLEAAPGEWRLYALDSSSGVPRQARKEVA